MCLATPLKLTSIDTKSVTGTVDLDGGELTVTLDLVPDAAVGDYVLVHAGMAIDTVADEDAEAMLDTITRYASAETMIEPEEHTQ